MSLIDPMLQMPSDFVAIRSEGGAGTLHLASACGRHFERLVALDAVRQQNGFGDLAHSLSALAAFLLHHAIGLFFIDTQLALQHALGSFDQLARFELAG